MSSGPEPLVLIEKLMALAQKGVEYDKYLERMKCPGAVIEHTDPVAQAIRKAGNNICAEISAAVRLLTYSPRK